MTTPPPPSPQDNHFWKSQYRQQISPQQPHDLSHKSSVHSNGKMKLGKTTSCPVSQGELPPLVGVPHAHEKSRFYNPTTPDSTAIQTLHHGPAESEFPPGAGGASPLIHRRLKFMVRQCSDSELLKHHGKQNLPPGSTAASPVPHPPDTSPRSRNSSGSNSPQVFRKPSLLNPAVVVGTNRASRSLDGSPMIVRRIRGGAKQHLGGGESPTPTGTEPSGKTRRTRPFSFGSFTDVLQHVANTGEASPRSGGSPYIVRRTGSLRGGTLMPTSRPDTPATESMYDPRKSHHHSSSSGERNGVDDSDVTSVALEDSSDLEGNVHLRRRLRHDSGSQHAQRNSTGHVDYNRNLPKQPACDDQESDHEVDDDTNFPSNLYDIQERRESVLSIEACQEIARRVANEAGNAEKNDSDDHDGTSGDHTTKPRDSTPEYRKLPLSTDVRVTCWLKGIQDPTEAVPPKFDRILPEII